MECLDRVYLNGYVPNLQVGGQVVNFLTHRGFPIPSPALLEKNGIAFRRNPRRRSPRTRQDASDLEPTGGKTMDRGRCYGLDNALSCR